MTRELAIYYIEKLKRDQLNRQDILLLTDFFFSYQEWPSKKFDMMLVLGSSSIKRVQKAVAIYQMMPSKMLFSGGTYLPKEQMCEWEKYFLYAVCHGVDPASILIETKSTNTQENFLFSAPLLASHKVHNCLLVTNAQHMPRALLIAKKILPTITFTPCVSYASAVSKEGWATSSYARKILCGELERLVRDDLLVK